MRLLLGLLVALMMTACTGKQVAPDAPAHAGQPVVSDEVTQAEEIIPPGPADCPPAPLLTIRVAEKELESGQRSGNGHYCSAIADGLASDALEPVPVQPGAAVVVTPGSTERWESITVYIYVFADATKLHESDLPPEGGSLSLPKEPGTYTVTVQGRSKHGSLNTYFRVLVSP